VAPPLPPSAAGHGRRNALLVALAFLLAGLTAYRLGAPPESPPQSALPVLDEAAILDRRPTRSELVRLAGEDPIYVLIFPTLADQAAAMNRVAALTEKIGMPRDRLVAPEELDRAIAARGDTAATWYVAHDYTRRQLDHFFALAASNRQPLSAAELALREHLSRLAAGEYALLTISAETTGMDETMRAAVLRHEVAHGWFFTRPGFAAQVVTIWHNDLTEAERDAVRRFLASEGYDVNDARLVANEAMAYLAHTPDSRLFSPKSLGISPERAAVIRARYEAALR
jgi:hypothetical protein